MMRTTRLILTCFLVSLLVLGCPTPRPPDGPPEIEQGERTPVFVERPVKFCWQPPPAPWSGGLQVLLDSSGSMVGFKRAVPRVVNWLQHGVSQLQTSTFSVTNSRLCQFS